MNYRKQQFQIESKHFQSHSTHVGLLLDDCYISSPGDWLQNIYTNFSLTSVIGKVLGSLLRDHITQHLDQQRLIYDSQRGFRKGKSCTTNLLEHLEILTRLVDEGIPVDVMHLDLAKAFDTVPHKRLIAKIRPMELTGWC